MALGGALGAPSFAQTDPVHGGTLRFVLGSAPASLALGFASGRALTVTTKIREGLLKYGTDLSPQPSLATAWEANADATAFTFTLRAGVKWHDGAPLTPEDVVFSVDFFKAINNNILVTYTGAEVNADGQVVVHIASPTPWLTNLLGPSNLKILPAHVYEGLSTEEIRNSEILVGTGPFIFEGWDRGSLITLARNDNYWDADKPYLDRIVFPIIPDAASRTVALETERVDIGAETPVPRSDIARLQELDYLQVTADGYARNPLVVHVGFNLENPYLQDVRVREAIEHVLDKDALLENIWFGRGILTDSFVPPQHGVFHNDAVAFLARDLEAAKALLDEVSLAAGADGIRFSLDYVHFPVETLARLGDYLKSELAQIGIGLNVRTLDQAGFFKAVWTDYDFGIYGQQANNNADRAIAVPRTFLTSEIRPGVNLSNGLRYSNPEVDRLLLAAAAEPDVAKRAELYHTFQ